MNARIGRLWRRPATSDTTDAADGVVATPGDGVIDDRADEQSPLAAAAVVSAAPSAGDDPASEADGPEQPVLLAPAGVSRQIHVGDVLPPAGRRWPGHLARLPEVPKRAILAAGLCAGLAAPTITRHLVARLLSGPGGGSSGGAQATLEITRIVFHGPLTAEAIATIHKALTAGRR